MSFPELNEAQCEGALHIKGPAMIIAGAGAGKTKVLTCRIAHLLQQEQVDPFRILALTFTNKAAKEMRERIENLIGQSARDLWMGTFHSIFARILRIEAEKIGFPRDFSIYDKDDCKSLVKSILKDLGLDDKIYKPNVILSRISAAKSRLISAKAYVNNPVHQVEDENASKPKMGEIYLQYAERCFKASAMDFDDLLLNTHKLFSQHPDVLEKYQQRFEYILIDEFQDTNMVQYAIIKDLARVHQNICVVGDDAQSIYAFRGADLRNMLTFEEDYPNLKTIRLEQNYRSTQNIVNAANSVIRNNKRQLKKDVWTANDTGELLSITQTQDDIQEATSVARSIFDLGARTQSSYNHFAVLYRTNSQSRTIEEALRRMNIPYRLIGGISFYQRKEVKDLLAYLRFLVNPNDEEALKRIINLPKRGIGNTSMDKIRLAAADHTMSLWQVMNNIHHFLKGNVAAAVDDFTQMMKSIALDVPNKDAFEIANTVAQRSGLLKELYAERTVEGLSRYENVQELLNGIKTFVADPDNDDKSLSSFLQAVALITSADQADEDEPRVTLMTIHSSKGTEYDYVYLVGMEEGLFPSQMMLAERADLEEERRLFYVALTRAKKRVFLSHAFRRFRFGKLMEFEPSRFLQEIDPVFREVEKPPTGFRAKPAFKIKPKPKFSKPPISTLKPIAQHKPPANFQASNTQNLQPGMKVLHPKFGKGEVLDVVNNLHENKARINFQQVGEKTLLLAFAKLQILS